MINHFINKGIEYPIELLDQITKQIFSDFDMIIRNLNIIQYTDDELLNLNKEVLNHNYYTDILTFNDIYGNIYRLYPINIKGSQVSDDTSTDNKINKEQIKNYIYSQFFQ